MLDLMLDVSRADLVAGVAGSGTMGRGIVQVLAQSGVRTLVFDAQPGAAGKAKDSIAQTLGKLAERGKLERGAVDAALGRIELVERLDALAPCQLVVEAIVEDLGAKRELLSKLEGIVGADSILASNTSSLSVTAMAAACRRPQRVAGYHFFNPVPVMKIVEVVAGELTEAWVTGALSALAGAWATRRSPAGTRPGSWSTMPAAPTFPRRCASYPKGSPISRPSTASSWTRRDFALDRSA
jgi:3-hydroxybutyryl-CoA dehydrogenase